ncbi:TPA: hypothetical protein ACH3X1_007000 [Trebouxia sp. C0004]
MLLKISLGSVVLLVLLLPALGATSAFYTYNTVSYTGDLSAQRTALMALYSATEGPTWTRNDNWGSSVSHCSWFGVLCCDSSNILPGAFYPLTSCNAAGAVLSVALPGNNLQGTIPDQAFFPDLVTLVTLDLRGNNLTGTLPSSLTPSNLQYLSGIFLDRNGLTGTIPAAVFQFKTLMTLRLGQNQLSGALYPSISGMDNLIILRLSDNQLTGSIPYDWYEAPKLGTMYLNGNQLIGKIPASSTVFASSVVATWTAETLAGFLVTTAMRRLNLAANQLTGTIPAGLWRIRMQEVDLSDNKLTGTLPFSLNYAQDLRVLDLSNNSLSGPLPALFTVDHLVSMDVSSNELTGTIPGLWVQSAYLSSMDLSRNSLSGSLPSFFDAFELETLSISFSGLTAGNATNQRGVHLPSFADYNSAAATETFAAANAACVQVVPNQTYMPSLNTVNIGPDYGNYEECSCNSGYKRNTSAYAGEHGQYLCIDVDQQDRAFLYFIIPFAVLMVVAVPIIVLWTRMSLPKYVGRWNRKKGPPESGQTVSLVLTDVEGSTELWEAFQEVMQVATPIHDRIMRAKISHYNGYEVTTEGDAFILAFHDPADAVAWCMATQQALLTAPWPTELIGHHRSSIRTSTKVVSSAERAVHLAASEVLFRGLRVRMGIGTGIIGKVQVHELTKRREYTGPVMDLAKAVSECPSGGQIVCCSATFASILDQQARILQQVPPQADHDVLYEMLSHPEGATDAMQSSLSEPMLNNTGNASSTHLLEGQTDPATTTKALAKPDAWVQAGKNLFQRATGNSNDKVKMLNMGQHILDSLDTPQQLYELCIPGLENRAVLFPPLTHSTELAPGYFAAPAARLYPLSHRKSRRPKPLPPVTLVFCAIDGYHDVMAENHVHGELTTTQCYNACRQLLKDRNGYECGTEEGTFMAAFASGTDALQFCVVAQEVLLDTAWSQDALAFEQWKAILGKDVTVAFRGPRVKMSIVQDIPTSIGPHPDTGCAMYHGPMAGSAAKLCHFVSHGGQIILPSELAEVVLADWTGSVPPMPSAGQSLFLTAHHAAGSNLTGSNWDSAKSSPASDISSRRTSEAGEADKSKPKTSPTTTKTRMAMEAGRGDGSGTPVPLTKEAIKSAQLNYQGSFKDPEVLRHWSGSGNLRPSGPAGTAQHARISEDPFCNLADKPRAPKHERAEGATRRASTNTAGVPLKSAVRRPSLGPTPSQTALAARTVSWNPANFSQAAGWLAEAGHQGSDTGRNSQADYAPDTLDIDSLPGSVEATDASRKDSPQKSLVHGAFLRAASVHKIVSTSNTSVLARSSSSMNGRVEVMMSHLPDGAQAVGGGGGVGGGTPKTSYKMPSMKSSLHDLVQDRWKKIPGVQFHHLGQIQFRDTPEEYTLMQVNSERLASREFAEGLPTKRAIRTAPARGHIYSVQFHEGARHVADVLAKKRASNSLAASPRATEG